MVALMGLGGLLVGAGCRSQGSASFKFVDPARMVAPADASKLKIAKRTTIFVDAKPVGSLASPRFPVGSFRAPNRAVTIVVRVAVDENGRATVLGKSLADLSLPTPFTEACADTIEEAVAQWKFEPAQLAVLEPQKDGRPLLVSSAATDTVFETSFTFDPSGSVGSKELRSGKKGKGAEAKGLGR